MSADPRCEICGVPLAVGVDDPPDERPRFAVDPLDLSRCFSHGPSNLGAAAPRPVLVEEPPESCDECAAVAASRRMSDERELKLRLEQAEQRVETLTAERDHFKAMLRERAARHLEAEEALEKKSLDLREIAKPIDARHASKVEP